jgi:hypothetical protein
MTASKLDYIINIKKIDVMITGSLSVVAYVKYKGHYATIEYDVDRGWKIRYNGVPRDVVLDAKNELWKRVQNIMEKIDEILALGNGLGLVISFK